MASNRVPAVARALTNARFPRLALPAAHRSYTCAASCQQPSPWMQPTRQSQPTTTRTFTHSPSSRNQHPSSPDDILSNLTTTTSYYAFFPSTFPSGPPPSSPFTPDLKALRREFLSLQARAHPDVASPTSDPSARCHIEALSMRINEAYRTLADPLLRAAYLLAQHGIDVDNESSQLNAQADQGLLMEVLAAQEELEEVREEGELVGLREENERRIEACVEELGRLVEREEWESVARETVRLRYWRNIETSLREWEPGRGSEVSH